MVAMSRHSIQRLVDRLDGLVTADEVISVVGRYQFKVGKTWVFIKDLGRTVTLTQKSTNGSYVNGSQVWAIVRRAYVADEGAVATVVLAGRNKAPESGAHYIPSSR